MKTTYRSCLLLFLFALLSGIAQAQVWRGENITFNRNRYKVTITVVEDTVLLHQLTHKYETTEWKYPARPVISGRDSIMSYLGKEIQFLTRAFSWDREQTPYVREMVCRNGMRLIFYDSMNLELYYPDDDIIGLRAVYPRQFNLSDGEDAYLIERTDQLNGDLQLIGVQYNGVYSKESDVQLLLQEPDADGKRQTVLDFTQLLDEPTRLDFYHVIDGRLYFLSYDEWWSVNFEKTDASWDIVY